LDVLSETMKLTYSAGLTHGVLVMVAVLVVILVIRSVK